MPVILLLLKLCIGAANQVILLCGKGEFPTYIPKPKPSVVLALMAGPIRISLCLSVFRLNIGLSFIGGRYFAPLPTK